jgi:hypothetical protein
MNNVIDGKDRFEFKALLDDASKNLTAIADALGSAQGTEHNLPDEACRMVELFAKGAIKPFYCPFEDSDLLYDMMHSQSELYGQLLRITFRFAHRDCHLLTVALAGAMQLADVRVLKVVDQSGAPLHSGLSLADSTLFLDANGVHTPASVLEHWEHMRGGPVFLRLTTAEKLMGLGNFAEADLQEALGEFGFVAAFMMGHLETLAEIPDFDMDDDLDDDDFSL